jgi:GT2 family glycosyltransferase
VTKPLSIIPTYVRKSTDVLMLEKTLVSLRKTAGDATDVLVVDDGSPEPDLVAAIAALCERFDADLVDKSVNEGFARTVNVGLHRCLAEGRDAVLVNSDIEFGLTDNWVGLMQAQLGDDDKPASVVGALLLYPNGLIQHAGIYFSFLSREFGHRYQFGPGNLPEAQQAAVCPVTGALQFIRYEALENVGLYDESFKLGWEDVDYCARVWMTGRQNVYQPGIRAVHHESFFRGQGRADKRIEEWTEFSWRRFVGKYATVSFAEFCPDLMPVGT